MAESKRLQEINEGQIVLKTSENEEKVFSLLFTFDSDETKKSYMTYTDDSEDAEGNTQVYASIYDPTGEDLNLYPIETEREWQIIQEILNGLQEQVAENQQGE